MLVTVYVGLGFGVVMAYVKTPLAQVGLRDRGAGPEVSVPYLAASVLMLGCALAGMRVVLSMPINLQANVIFRLTEMRGAEVYARVVRRSFYMLAYAPVLLLVALPFLWMRPRLEAMGHLGLLALLGVILSELCLHGFRKVPFTCSYLPGKTNVPILFWGGVLLILPLTNELAEIELGVLSRPGRYAATIALLDAAAMLARWRTTAAMRRAGELRFEESSPPELLALGLDRQKVAAAERL